MGHLQPWTSMTVTLCLRVTGLLYLGDGVSLCHWVTLAVSSLGLWLCPWDFALSVKPACFPVTLGLCVYEYRSRYPDYMMS